MQKSIFVSFEDKNVLIECGPVEDSSSRRQEALTSLIRALNAPDVIRNCR